MLKPSITALSTRVLAVADRSRVSRLYLALMVSLLLTMVAGDALAAKAAKGFASTTYSSAS
jgi:hypothetical protein